MAANLTAGAVAKMMNGEIVTQSNMMPILQITDLRLVQSNLQQQSNERYKLVLSDGIQSQRGMQGMLNTNLNHLVKQGKVRVGSVIKLTHFICNTVQGRRIVIIMEVDIIAESCDIIGKANDNSGQTGSVPVSVNTQNIGGAGLANQPQSQAPQRFVANDPGQTGSVPVSVNTQNIGSYEQQQHGGSRSGLGNPTQPQALQRQGFVTKAETSTPLNRPYAVSNSGYGSANIRQEQQQQQQVRVPPPQSTYSRPVQSGYQQQQQQQPIYPNRGPVSRNEALPHTLPIAALNPYNGRWTIKVRVTGKSEIRHFNGQRGNGKVFSFDLLDADKGEIRVTCFNEIVDNFFEQIVVGKLYLISKGNLKPARKEFNHLKNDYEIHLDSASTIQQCYEDDTAIPHVQFHFRPISDIENMVSNSITDIIGIVSSINPTGALMRKDGTETQKRSLQLKDMSGKSVEVTMWGSFCNAEGQQLQTLCDSGVFPVLAVKAGRISEFNGKQVSTIGSSQLFIDPDFTETRELKEWYNREGKNAPCVSLSREFTGVGKEIRKVITQIKDEKLGTSEKPDWITVTATISFMKYDSFCYTACPLMNGERPCSKKVTNNGDGRWRCERCDKVFAECDYRYILQVQIQDHSGYTWATAFQEAGEEIIGMPAKELYLIKDELKDEEQFDAIIKKAVLGKYTFKLKVKEETFSDEARVKATIVKADKMNYVSDTRLLLGAIEKMRGEGVSSVNGESSSYATGLPAANGVGYGHQYGNDLRPMGGVMICDACGSHSHVSANCPTIMSEPQGQYMNGAAPGRYVAGGGMPRQHVGGY